MNWLDWLLVLIITLSVYKGLRGGFLRGIAGIGGLLGGIWAAITYHGQLARYLSEKWGWDQKISEFLSSRLQQNSLEGTRDNSGDGFWESLLSPADAVDTVVNAINLSAETILNIAAFGIIVIFVYIILGGILKLISRIVSGTPLSPLDRLAGGVLGCAKGFLFASIIMFILLSLKLPAALLSAGEGPGFIALAVEKSQLAPLLFNLINILNLPVTVLNVNMAFI
jgi:uncharacterized membrane protein required for colicin V production